MSHHLYLYIDMEGVKLLSSWKMSAAERISSSTSLEDLRHLCRQSDIEWRKIYLYLLFNRFYNENMTCFLSRPGYEIYTNAFSGPISIKSIRKIFEIILCYWIHEKRYSCFLSSKRDYYTRRTIGKKRICRMVLCFKKFDFTFPCIPDSSAIEMIMLSPTGSLTLKLLSGPQRHKSNNLFEIFY